MSVGGSDVLSYCKHLSPISSRDNTKVLVVFFKIECLTPWCLLQVHTEY